MWLFIVSLLLLVMLPYQATAVTYYVDPALPNCSGRNANAGTDPANPWCNPPGTRNTANSAFYSTSWGTTTTSNKFRCGDTILLKGGSTQASGQGGAWRIDNNYYRDCTSTSRTTIRVATPGEWSGSNGNFILNGSGVTATGVGAYGSGGFAGLLDLENIDYVTAGGNSAAQRLEIMNAGGSPSDDCGVIIHSNEGGQPNGVRVQWVSSHNNEFGGVTIGYAQNFVVANVITTANGGPGFSTGMWVDARATNGAFVDAESTADCTAQRGGQADTFGFLGADGIWCVRCKATNSPQRGFDTGSGSPIPSFSSRVTCRDCEFWNNGTSSDPNVGRLGACWSGDDDGNNAHEDYAVLQRSILYRNTHGGGFCAYGQGWGEAWNSVWYGNGYAGGEADIMVSNQADLKYFGVFNSIVQKNSTSEPWGPDGPSGFGTRRCPRSNFNLFRPVSSDNETLASFSCTGANGFSYTTRSFSTASQAGFFGPNDKIGIAHTIGFVRLDNSVYQNTDFHLTAGSAAIDAGTYMMRANGAGTNATTINVLGNGGSNDPRFYFIGPASFLDAAPDTIQIQGCGQVTITGLTATSISFTPACSWANGAGVHFPWSGAAPDMGVFESGLSNPGAPAPPVLLSVEPVP